MAVRALAGGTVGDVSFAASAAVALLRPLAAQIDVFLGTIVGPLQAEMRAQLTSSLELSAGVSISNPLSQLKDLLTLVAQLKAALALGLAAPSVNLEASAHARAAAALRLKLSLLSGAVEAMLKFKTPALALAARLLAGFSAGGVALLDFESSELRTAGQELQQEFEAGIDVGSTSIDAGAPAYGFVLVTSSQQTHDALRLLLRG